LRLIGNPMSTGPGQRDHGNLTHALSWKCWNTWTKPNPMGEPDTKVTSLLRQWSGGDPRALEELVPIIHKELRRLAHYHLRRERDGHTLQTTALVQEVYLRFCSQEEPRWENRAHFFAARMMRRILVDYSHRRDAEKRGADVFHVSLDHALSIPVPEQLDLIGLDGTLDQLALFDARKRQVVEMRSSRGSRPKKPQSS